MNNLDVGIENLLLGCAKVKQSESLLIVHEDPALGWYDDATPVAVAAAAQALGLQTSLLQVGAPQVSKDRALLDAIAAHDSTLFLARVGDQDRFGQGLAQERSVMCYARTVTALASAFGQAPHAAMVALKEAVNDVMLTAGSIEITCPLGTRYQGRVGETERENSDVTVKRFPLCVPQPIPATGFSGQVVLTRYLTPTGSMPYEPASCPIQNPVVAHVEQGRITGFEGEDPDVSAIRAHYDTVAGQFGIEPNVVHSFHAGIHPGCAHLEHMDEDPDRWSNTIFGNPHFLHFHTCGDYAPGEICWMVLDPTIRVDGTEFWRTGELQLGAFAQTAAVAERWPQIRQLFDAPCSSLGLGD